MARGITTAVPAAAALPLPGTRQSSIVQTASHEARPLSFAQERLWFLEQLTPGSATYNVPMAWRVGGELDVPRLQRSLDAVVLRHEVLRSRIEVRQGQPAQVVEATPPALVVIDLRDRPPATRAAALAAVLAADARQPFDLARGPVLRAHLVRLGPADHVLQFTVHHIAFDGWSAGIFFRELAAAYAAGGAAAWPPLPIHYADYAAWQRRQLAGPALDASLAYWKAQLAGVPVLQLPTDRPRPAVQTFAGAYHTFTVPPPVREALHALSRAEHATLFMTLLAAFQVLLARYTGQTDIPVATSVAGRTQADTEPLIGYFVNTLVLRTQWSGTPSFRTLLHRVRDTALAAYAHQAVPFEKLVEELKPARDLSHTPLFHVMFALQNVSPARLELPGLAVQAVPTSTATVKSDLVVSMEEHTGELKGIFNYNTSLFDAQTIERMGRHYVTLLRSATSAPDAPIGRLPMLPPSEREEILVRWNDTAVEYAAHTSIAELVWAQARQTPDALAVADDRSEATYAALCARARRLARVLRELGVGVEEPVGVCTTRSIDMVVSMLGAWRARGAYVPLDSRLPAPRVSQILADARARIVVADQHSLDRLPADVRIVRVDQIDGEPDDAAENEDPLVHAESLACVIYTSGSTGTPKGVQLTHRNMANIVAWCRREYRLTPADRVSQVASSGFDVCGSELWPALTAGSSVHIMPDEVLSSIEGLWAWLAERSITVCFLPTPLAELAVDQPVRRAMPLRLLVTAGDALHRRPPRSATYSLLNGYGPTECSIYASAAAVAADGPLPPPIGRPLANARIHILDEHFEPVPPGIPGEIWIGGDGVARGYLGRPTETAERFMPDRFSAVAGRRLYRTGDLGRYRPGGEIDFLGRVDRQVKVRAFRVELDEVEATLHQHPGVSAATVMTYRSGSDKALIAYVAGRPAAHISAAALREFLAARLPHYMVPSEFVVLDRLPLTPNGKIDRSALSRPTVQRPRTEPDAPLERTLLELWRDVLGTDDIGVEDDFFDLGGHSMLAIRLLSRIRDAFHVELPLRTIFERPTIVQLAAGMPAPGSGAVDDGNEIRPVPRGQRALAALLDSGRWPESDA